MLFTAFIAVAASGDQRQAVLTALFRDPAHVALNLSPAFAAAIPEARLRSLIADLEQANGAFTSVSDTGSAYIVHLARADVTARIALDSAGSITGLRLTRVVPRGETAAQFAARIAALPGAVSVLLTENGSRKIAVHADAALAVGSAFKLVVLRAVADAVGAHRLAWDQVVRLDPASRSLPSGFLQTWPDGTPLTVATLADAMISVSDNTAADALAHLVGRAALEAISPRNTPFLTTREMFILRSGGVSSPALDWTAMKAEARRALLDKVAHADLPGAPVIPVLDHGPEWYMTTQELCGLLRPLAGLDAFRINPGPGDPADWKMVAFKGGSDEGVLNLSFYGVTKDGREVCAAATWNDNKTLDEDALVTPFAGLLRAVATDAAK